MKPLILRHLPSPQCIEAFLISQSKLDFTYSAVGATATAPPAGFHVDLNRIKLGQGEPVFLTARAALENWTHFNLGWLKAVPLESTIQAGGMVAVLARFFGLWWLMACRIVYLIDDDDGSKTRFGFAYGTLPAHAERGEERFFVEWDRTDDSVWYDILAFSRPHGLLSRLGNPCLRTLQHRFAEDSKTAMVKAVMVKSK